MVILIQLESLCLQMYILNLCTISLLLTYSSAAQHQSFFFSFFTIIIVSVCVFSTLHISPNSLHLYLFHVVVPYLYYMPTKIRFSINTIINFVSQFQIVLPTKKFIILLVVRVLQMQSQDDNQGAWLLPVTRKTVCCFFAL